MYQKKSKNYVERSVHIVENEAVMFVMIAFYAG